MEENFKPQIDKTTMINTMIHEDQSYRSREISSSSTLNEHNDDIRSPKNQRTRPRRRPPTRPVKEVWSVVKTSGASLCILAVTIGIVLLMGRSGLSQNPQDMCGLNGGSLASFICKAGQTVIGGASRMASNLLSRPKHWGVPEGERLDLHEDYHNHLNPQAGVIHDQRGASVENHQHSLGNQQHHHHDQQIDDIYLRARGHKRKPGSHGKLTMGSGPPKHEQSLANHPQLPATPVPCHAIDGSPGLCIPLHDCYHQHGTNSARYRMDGQQCPRGLSLVCCPKQRRKGDDEVPDRDLDSNNDDRTAGITTNSDSLRRHSTLQQNAKQQQQAAGRIAIDTLKDIISQVFDGPNSEADRSNEIERNILIEGLSLKRDSPSDLHQRFIQLRNGKLIRKLAKDGADFLEVATRIARHNLLNQQDLAPSSGPNNRDPGRHQYERECSRQREASTTNESSHDPIETNCVTREARPSINRRVWLPEIDFSETNLVNRCPGDPICGPQAAKARYRTYDGSCNNLFHTAWGRSNTPYTRILPPDYEDGVNEIRSTGVTGARLPNARTVSLATVVWSDKPDSRASLMLMQWGQFVDHDITLAATTPMITPHGTNIDCCNRRLLTDPRFKHPACISVLLPDLDPFYSRHKVGCMNLVRNAPSPPIGCRLRAREQLNQLTHFIDGSMVYGNDEQQGLALRLFRGGLLKSSLINGNEFLPFDGRLGEGCILPHEGIRRGMRCFVAGDNRVNELTGLVTTHAMFLREHNRIARILDILNPEWSDERIYQEARRLVIAEIQHVTYNEWLPLILGPVVMRDFQLELSASGSHTHDYDPQTEPTIINEFAGAAYRLHSLVQSAFNFQTEDGHLIQQFKLRNIFNNPASLYREGNYDGCIHSMVNEPSQSIDNHFTEELTNHLFQDTNSTFGMDLVTVNIQRGRDHGIPGYNFFRQACGLSRLENFEQLNGVMVEGAGRTFSELYAHVDDIDLFIAGSYEKKLKDAMVGPVFACIIGEQFRRLRVGDRFWYENGKQSGSFSKAQLAEIKRVSMARLICDNSDFIERIQPLAFLRPTEWNPKVPCEHLPWLDLRLWRQPELVVARRMPHHRVHVDEMMSPDELTHFLPLA